MEEFTLNNDVKMPVIGLGTYPMNGSILIETMLAAIENGYSSFDTSSAYENSEAIGEAIRISGKKREQIFITTKLSNTQQRSGDIEESLRRSLRILGLEYIDLYLMHWPNPGTYLKSWIEMEKLYIKGLTRSIGVSNFHEHHLNKLLKVAKIAPMINQIELHPYLNQKQLVKYCEKNSIKIQAYSPFARMHKELIKDKLLVKIANKYQKTIPQIILRWNFQNGIISIPKTQNITRLKENISIFNFSLNREEIEEINGLNKNLRIRYDPDNCDFSKL